MARLVIGTNKAATTPAVVRDKSPEYYLEYAVTNGVLDHSATGAMINLTGVTTIGDYVLYRAFKNNQNITTVDMSGITSLGEYALGYCFSGSSITELDLSGITQTSNYKYELEGICSDCSNLTTVKLDNLRQVGSYGLRDSFYRSSNLTTVNLDLLETVYGENAMRSTFYGTHITTMNFVSLKKIDGYNAMGECFANCSYLTSLYFPSLLAAQCFNEYTDCFDNMLNRTSNVTLHFPSNFSSIIPNLDGYPNFGGTNTTILYDLPATA